ncbi:hypothetical protein MKX01_023495 [Papaver californicum]|nr:hypothetical protein MKX01_023495 [Papaver californicum]
MFVKQITPHSWSKEGPVEEGGIFFLSLIEHTLRLPPHLLSLPLPKAIRGELEKLFVDKVIAQLGLCVSIYDIKSINGGFIFAGDGASTYTVDFRLIMFRPFEGEILSGKGFLKTFVPAHLLPNPSKFSEDRRWTWMYGDVELTIEQDDEIPPIPLEQENDSKAFAPMASIDFDGLGLISWWV